MNQVTVFAETPVGSSAPRQVRRDVAQVDVGDPVLGVLPPAHGRRLGDGPQLGDRRALGRTGRCGAGAPPIGTRARRAGASGMGHILARHRPDPLHGRDHARTGSPSATLPHASSPVSAAAPSSGHHEDEDRPTVPPETGHDQPPRRGRPAERPVEGVVVVERRPRTPTRTTTRPPRARSAPPASHTIPSSTTRMPAGHAQPNARASGWRPASTRSHTGWPIGPRSSCGSSSQDPLRSGGCRHVRARRIRPAVV